MHLALTSRWLAAVLALTLAATGCGDDGGSADAPADDPEVVTAVSAKIEEAAGRVANEVKDRNLPGRKQFKIVCLSSEDAARRGISRDSVLCHVEAFTTPTKKLPRVVYVWSEDWQVPVVDGTPGEPTILGEYRIKNYLEKDHRLNCSGGRTPNERCTGVFPTPTQAAPPGGQGAPPPTGGQQEVPINP